MLAVVRLACYVPDWLSALSRLHAGCQGGYDSKFYLCLCRHCPASCDRLPFALYLCGYSLIVCGIVQKSLCLSLLWPLLAVELQPAIVHPPEPPCYLLAFVTKWPFRWSSALC